jgi:hypothetical protein
MRLWSLLPFVQERSGTYTSTLKVAHFDGPKYQEVSQRSPALGSILESKQPEIHLSTGCHLEVSVSRIEGKSRLINPECAFPSSLQSVGASAGVKGIWALQ